MHKINQIFKLHLKCVRRSMFLPILLVAPFIFLLLRYNTTSDKVGGWLSVWASTITYGYMVAAICLIVLGIYMANDDYEVIHTLNIEERDIVIGKVCCLMLFSFIILLEPIIMVIFHLIKFKDPTSNILINILLNLFATWGTGLSFASILGFSIGYFIRNKWSYLASILALFIISPYNRYFNTNNTIVNTIYSLINIDSDKINIPLNAVTQNSFNLFWIYDKLFLVLLSIGLIALCILKGCIHKLRYKRKVIIFYCTYALLVILLFSMALQYYPRVYEAANFPNSNILNDMIIERYKMNIKSGNIFNNNCTIELNNTSKNEIANVKLYLDKIFNIENIYCENSNLKYVRNDNTINITFNKAAKPNEKIKISIIYYGHVNYITMGGYDKYFTNTKSTFLPPNEFIWYPRDNSERAKYFDVHINSNNTIYSNLQLSSLDTGFKKEYILSGNKKEIFIISGYLSERDIQGNKIIAPEDYLINKSNKIDALIKYMKEKIVPKIDPSLKFVKAVESKDRPIYFVPLTHERLPYKIYDDCIFIDSYTLYGM